MNPAIDLSFEIDHLVANRKLRCAALRRDAGGGGINVARVIRRLGGETRAIFPAGGPTGRRLCAMLDAQRVPHLAIEVGAETREDFTVLERQSGVQYRFVLPGDRLARADCSAVLARIVSEKPKLLVASGSLPPGAPANLYGRLARDARAAGVRLVLDAAGAALAHGLAAGVWLAKPNVEELEEVTGAPLVGLEARLAACRALIARGGAQIVALSMGAEGAILVTGDQAWRAEAPRLAPLSTVGAGDSFVGGLVYALAKGLPPPEALRWGVATGSAALLAAGTQLCRRSDALRLRQDVRASAL